MPPLSTTASAISTRELGGPTMSNGSQDYFAQAFDTDSSQDHSSSMPQNEEFGIARSQPSSSAVTSTSTAGVTTPVPTGVGMITSPSASRFSLGGLGPISPSAPNHSTGHPQHDLTPLAIPTSRSLSFSTSSALLSPPNHPPPPGVMRMNSSSSILSTSPSSQDHSSRASPMERRVPSGSLHSPSILSTSPSYSSMVSCLANPHLFFPTMMIMGYQWVFVRKRIDVLTCIPLLPASLVPPSYLPEVRGKSSGWSRIWWVWSTFLLGLTQPWSLSAASFPSGCPNG